MVSTRDFDSFSLGSSPNKATLKFLVIGNQGNGSPADFESVSRKTLGVGSSPTFPTKEWFQQTKQTQLFN